MQSLPVNWGVLLSKFGANFTCDLGSQAIKIMHNQSLPRTDTDDERTNAARVSDIAEELSEFILLLDLPTKNS